MFKRPCEYCIEDILITVLFPLILLLSPNSFWCFTPVVTVISCPLFLLCLASHQLHQQKTSLTVYTKKNLNWRCLVRWHWVTPRSRSQAKNFIISMDLIHLDRWGTGKVQYYILFCLGQSWDNKRLRHILLHCPIQIVFLSLCGIC